MVVGRDGDAVRLLDLRLRQHARHLPFGVNAIHAFDIHFHVAAIAVAGIGEPDPACYVGAHIVGAVVAFPLVAVRQHGDPSRLQVGADDPPPPAGAEPISFTTHEPAPSVKAVAVRASALRTEDRDFAGRSHFENSVAGDIAKKEVSRLVGRRSFQKADQSGDRRLRSSRNQARWRRNV